MLQEVEIETNDEPEALEMDGPAASHPAALLAKAGSLSGALVQRGRERAPRITESSVPVPVAPAPAFEPLSAPAPAAALASGTAAPRASRWTDVLFAAACCVAFFASFLFVLSL